MEICLNCGTELKGKYCYVCGQEKISGRMSMKSLLHDLIHSTFHWESTILSTIKELFLSPGKFIQNYLSGKRKSFAKPITFFILMLSLYVVIFHLLSEDYFSYLNKAITGNKGNNLAIYNVTASELQHMISNKMNYLMFLLPPFLALFFKLFFRKNRINFAESLAFSFFIIGLGLLISTLFTLPGFLDIRILNFRFALTYAYYIYAMVQFSGTGKAIGIFKAIVTLLLSYALFILTVTFLMIVYLYLTH